MIPGDPERNARADREAHGFDVPAGVWKSILTAGEGLGLNPNDMMKTATIKQSTTEEFHDGGNVQIPHAWR